MFYVLRKLNNNSQDGGVRSGSEADHPESQDERILRDSYFAHFRPVRDQFQQWRENQGLYKAYCAYSSVKIE